VYLPQQKHAQILAVTQVISWRSAWRFLKLQLSLLKWHVRILSQTRVLSQGWSPKCAFNELLRFTAKGESRAQSGDSSKAYRKNQCFQLFYCKWTFSKLFLFSVANPQRMRFIFVCTSCKACLNTQQIFLLHCMQDFWCIFQSCPMDFLKFKTFQTSTCWKDCIQVSSDCATIMAAHTSYVLRDSFKPLVSGAANRR